jgi:hypothetical protein
MNKELLLVLITALHTLAEFSRHLLFKAPNVNMEASGIAGTYYERQSA